MLILKDSVDFNALDIDYTNVREFIDGKDNKKLKKKKKNDRKYIEKK